MTTTEITSAGEAIEFLAATAEPTILDYGVTWLRELKDLLVAEQLELESLQAADPCRDRNRHMQEIYAAVRRLNLLIKIAAARVRSTNPAEAAAREAAYRDNLGNVRLLLSLLPGPGGVVTDEAAALSSALRDRLQGLPV